MNYKDYLKSDEWQNKRKLVIIRDWWRCKCCNSTKQLNVHHRTYKTIHTPEEINDLTLLCNRCHSLIHSHNNILQWNLVQPVSIKKKPKNKKKQKNTSIEFKEKESQRYWIYKMNKKELKINKEIWASPNEFIENFLRFVECDRKRQIFWEIDNVRWWSLNWYSKNKHDFIFQIIQKIKSYSK